jgi:hypothetical protein
MIEQDTEKLCLPGGRRVGQPGHDIAKEYIMSRMAETGLSYFCGENYALCYRALNPASGAVEGFTNLAGVLPGSDPNAMPVLLGAHYDSAIDAPCADDNAVSISMILEMAETLKKQNNRRSVIIAFFDGEEAPFFLTESMGSIRFYKEYCRAMDFASVIILDGIGHDFQTGVSKLDRLIPGISELLFVLGCESHETLPSLLEKAASSTEGLRIVPTLNRYIGDSSDYSVFRTGLQPYLFFSRGRGVHTHLPEDTIEWINFNGVRSVMELVLKVIHLIDLAPMENNRGAVDPFEFEIRMMKKAVGLPLPLVLMFLGLRRMSLKTREDLNCLARKLSGFVKL